MRFDSRVIPSAASFGVAILLAALILCLPMAAQAGESAPAPQAAASTTGAPAAGATKVHHVNGVTITWNLDEKRFQTPTAEQVEKLAADFRELMATKLAGAKGTMAAPGTLESSVLPDGTVKVRLTADQLSASVVRVDAAGKLVGEACVEGPVEAGKVLATPASPAGGEER